MKGDLGVPLAKKWVFGIEICLGSRGKWRASLILKTAMEIIKSLRYSSISASKVNIYYAVCAMNLALGYRAMYPKCSIWIMTSTGSQKYIP